KAMRQLQWFVCAKAMRQLQWFVCAKAMRQLQWFVCAKAMRQLQLRQGEIDLIYFTLTGLIFDLP
ncbi:hypothetical protein, partial [Lysinibacillus sp. RC79]|uniref:hypothetical protein n=1 Tax=Lysinibacillus sp. RC79 TaxID=3156296 RepID=UPI003512F51B